MEVTGFWGKALIIAVLLIGGVETLDVAVRRAPWPGAATRFFAYYRVLEKSGEVGVWERLAYSWMLAGGREAPGPTS